MISNIIKGNYISNLDSIDTSFFDSINDAVLIHDFSGNLIYANKSTMKLYGYSDYEMIDKNIFELREKKILLSADISTQSLKNQGKDMFETFIYRKDGSAIYTRIYSYIVKNDEDHFVLSVIHRIIDVDENTDQDANNEECSYVRSVNALVTIMQVRDSYTANHQRRVANLACKIAEELDIHSNRRRGIYIAGLLHDIGKIYVPNEILTRTDRINEYEFSIIKKHSEVGYNILSKLCFPWPIKDFVIQHHERLNGTGYPFKLVGNNIKLESMILAVADVVEAMASHRPYRPALSIDKALEEIANGKGIIYHSDVVDACNKILASNIFDFDNYPYDVTKGLIL